MAKPRTAVVKATGRAAALQAELAFKQSEIDALNEQIATAQQAAADQHAEITRQDHIHAEEIAAIYAIVVPLTEKVDRLLVAWDQLLKRAQG